jgi:hypothetical protein
MRRRLAFAVIVIGANVSRWAPSPDYASGAGKTPVSMAQVSDSV